jgi:hypothetical protein
MAKFVTDSVNTIEFPPAPGTVAVTVTVPPDREAVAVPGISALIAVTILLPSVVVLELSVTCPVPLRAAV